MVALLPIATPLSPAAAAFGPIATELLPVAPELALSLLPVSVDLT